MQAKPISVQLYSLRQEAESDFVGVLTRLAQIGYTGVEPAGLITCPRGNSALLWTTWA